MLEYRSTATSDGRSTEGAHGALLSRIRDGLGGHGRPAAKSRRCPCCGGPIRAGQRLTTIHGTRVHARCATARQ